jgi:hypothetical protein
MKKFLCLICTIFVACGASADTETLTWYVDGTTYDTTTCQSGGDVVLPATAPSKAGYTFVGWSFGTYDLSTLDASINGNRYYGRNASNTCYVWTDSHTQQSCTLSDYSDLELRQWKTLFNYGTVRGESACSASYGATIGEVGNPDISNPSNGGVYCWCHVTGFIPAGESVVRKPAVSLWAFAYAYSSASACASFCTSGCGNRVQDYSSLRAGLFGSVAN